MTMNQHKSNQSIYANPIGLQMDEIAAEQKLSFYELHATLDRALNDLDKAIKDMREFENNRFF